jgi:hypothetical protein
MKVSELIEKLKLYPQDYEAKVSTNDGDFVVVDFEESDRTNVLTLLIADDPRLDPAGL